MKANFDQAQIEWIKEVLDEHGEHVANLLISQIEKKGLKVTEKLMYSLRYAVAMKGMDPHLSLEFLDYGRFIEINYHKSRNTRQFSGVKPNGILMALHDNPQGRKKQKKDTRWYARTIYGSLNRLTGILLYN